MSIKVFSYRLQRLRLAFSVPAQRWADWRRERRIRRFSARTTACLKASWQQRDLARWYWAQTVAECKSRSPGRIARMERALMDRMAASP